MRGESATTGKRPALLVLVVLVLGGAVELRAQVCPADDATGLRRTLPVNVLDRQGNQVTGLTAANFRGEFRGRPVKILSAEWDTGPRRIVILLDISVSMTWTQSKSVLALRAAGDIARHTPPQSPVNLLTFAEKVRDRMEFVQDRQALEQRLTTLAGESEGLRKIPGRTALWDAILEAIALFDPPRLGDVIYVISDGGDNQSRTPEEKAKRDLVGAGVRLFAFLFRSRDEEEIPHLDPRILEELIAASGGKPLSVWPSAWPAQGNPYPRDDEYDLAAGQRLAGAARLLYQQMASFYRVEVELPQAVDPSTSLRAGKLRGWELEVVDEAGKKMKGVEVLYPRKLVPCPPTP